MDQATYLVAQALVELMDTNHEVRDESVKHNDWFNGLVDHLLEYEKSI
jgi:polyisoprenoid-binding protein YceI